VKVTCATDEGFGAAVAHPGANVIHMGFFVGHVKVEDILRVRVGPDFQFVVTGRAEMFVKTERDGGAAVRRLKIFF
jgi:hypothetical protein